MFQLHGIGLLELDFVVSKGHQVISCIYIDSTFKQLCDFFVLLYV